MKKHLVLIITVVLLSSVIVTAIGQYKNNQHKIIVARQAFVDQEAVALKAEHEARLRVSTAYSLLHVECEKGVNAYNAVTKTIQAKIPHPTCGPVIAQ